MQSSELNLNHLRTLLVLLREPNLSRAAEQLMTTQPSVSAALAQLRKAFGDPLLVRVGRNMEHTARAKELIGPIEKIFEGIEGLWQIDPPSPSQAERNFVVATTDYGTMMTAPQMLNSLMTSAPHIGLQYVDIPEKIPATRRAQEIDFYLVPRSQLRSPEFQGMKFIPLFKDRFVYLSSTKHRLAKRKTIRKDDLQSERLAAYYMGLVQPGTVEGRVLAEAWNHPAAMLQVQQFTLLPYIAAQTTCIAIVPRRVAEPLCRAHAVSILGDLDPPFDFEFCLAWDPLHQRDQMHTWMRNQFRDQFKAR